MQVRAATPADEPGLRAMVWLAARWDEHDPPPAPDPLPPELARYTDGYGARPGDHGVVALGEARAIVAACWHRLLPGGYGFVAADVPELSLAVAPGHRRRGLATALLTRLIGDAHALGHPALSLSVDPRNPARELYEALGFARVGEAGTSWTMLRPGRAGLG